MTRPPDQGPPNADAALEAQAWRWLRLLRSGDAREIDAQRLRRWIERRPAHRQAFNTVKQQWDAMAPVAREALWADPAAVPVRRRIDVSRRAFLGAGLSAAAIAGIAVANTQLGFLPTVDEWRADERTVAGEQRVVPAGDGIDVTLNTRTSIRRQAADGIDLITGEAAIDLQQGRAFAVVAGAGRSRAQSGGFEVRHLDGEVCVTCLSGSVQVEHPAGLRTLTARQQVRYGAQAIGNVDSGIDVDAVTAWRHGAVVFDQTRFAEVVEEINRYRAGRVLLTNEAARERRVSGRFEIRTLDLALLQLQESFGLTARALPAGVLILS